MRKEKRNNKGFSLVELIIVIAIMAILVVVSAPQYLRYVESSRNSTDMQNATEMVTAIQIYAADPEANPAITTADNGATITIGQTANANACPNAQIAAALTNAGLTPTTTTCRSRTAWDTYVITVNVDGNGNVSFTYTSTFNGSTPATGDAFEAKMLGQ